MEHRVRRARPLGPRLPRAPALLIGVVVLFGFLHPAILFPLPSAVTPRAIPIRFDGADGAGGALPLSLKGLALATADFDRDGWPDLASAWTDGKGGIIAIQQGSGVAT